MPAEPTTEVLTFLFTDIEGSTARWERDRDAMAAAVRRHDELTVEAVSGAGGRVVKSTGDGAHAVFADPDSAAAAALALRDELRREEWPPAVDPIRVRMGIHSGPAEARGGDYFGPTLNRAGRLMDAGHGGQILISEAARRLIANDALELRFLGEYRLRDLLSPERIHQLGDPETVYEPLRVINEKTHNLPVQVTSFVGRARELGELADLIATHRLVTLTGPGGTGKTRLALQSSVALLDHYDSVYFVPLANVQTPEGVAPAIATAIGVHEGASGPIEATLIPRLSAHPTLLILDNFEHLLDAAPLVGRLLEQAERLHVVATSRQLLRLRAEHHFPVTSLEVPTADQEVPAAELSNLEAVNLFEDRARAASPSFGIDDSNIHDVVAVCAMLDGLPLAIELAAARARWFTPAQLRDRLRSGLAALGTGPVDAPERHQTLTNTIMWSYDLLDADEATVFTRLAAFRGGASLDAVEHVCAAGTKIDAFAAIEALADKSLIRLATTRVGEMRVNLLETIHAFAGDRLELSGEYDEVQRTHASYFADRVEEAERHLRRAGQVEWTHRLEYERPNLNVALTWSFGSGNPASGLRIVAGLRDFWFYQGHTHDMRQWTTRALSVVGDAEEHVRAGVLMSAGFVAYNDHDPRAVELLDDATALFAASNDLEHQALAQVWAAGSRELLTEDLDGARRGVWRGLELARRAGAISVEAQALNFIGELERADGNLERAQELQSQALELSRQTGEMRRVAMVTHNLGLIAHGLGDDDTAGRLLHESLELAATQGFGAQTAHSLIGLAEQIALRGHTTTAAELIGAADEYLRVMGVTAQVADEFDQSRIREFVAQEAGPERYAEAAVRGARLELDEAVELVRSLPT